MCEQLSLPLRHSDYFICRAFWYIIQLIAFGATIYLLLFALGDLTVKPVYTQLKSFRYPVSNIPFPAVGVCTVNKISKKAAIKYAQFLSSKTSEYTFDWFFKRIPYIGRVLDIDLVNYDEFVEFQNVLDRFDISPLTGRFNTQEIIRDKVSNQDQMKPSKLMRMSFKFQLTPPCADILVKCQWEGEEVNCKEIFSYRKTRDGYCCAFNLVRPLLFQELK